MNIVITGSIAYDYLMKFPGYFKEHILPEKLESISLSFLVDSLVKRRGGIAPNIAYTMALLGGQPRMMATVGEDFEEYRAYLESKGIDTANVRVIEGDFTASFFANTDLSNAQIASFYPGAMAYAGDLSLHELEGGKPDLVVVSPNDPGAMRKYIAECKELGIPYLDDPSQQVVLMEGETLLEDLDGALALFCNDYECELIQKKTGLSAEEIEDRVSIMVVTRGEKGATICHGDDEFYIPVVPPAQIVDPTGVGDAFRGGFLVGYARGWDLGLCGRIGALAATYCLEVDSPQGHAYTPAEFVARFREHFEDEGALDELL